MSDVKNMISEHLRRRPAARAQDVYKLLFQGVFGVGHIVSDKAWRILVEEAGRIDLDDHADDPLIESVHPYGLMIRINLRQYINAGGDLEALYSVMIESAMHTGDPLAFMNYWGQFKEMVTECEVSIDLEEIKTLDDLIQREGLKPRHHTEPYREAYYPAYRVVLTKIYMDSIGLSG